jgi:hypothetical protein
MSDTDFNIAMSQLSTLASFANLYDNLQDPPVSMPPDRMRAAGVDPELWSGLGIVGVWAAIDAFGERRFPNRTGQLTRFKNEVTPSHIQILEELDDLRSLFAHNFAGIADKKFLMDSRRRCLVLGKRYQLTSGYKFGGAEGEHIRLNISDLKHYVSKGREILASLAR